MVDQTLVLSFDHPALLAMKERLPGIRTVITYEGRLVDTVGAARAARADAVWPASAFLAREDIETVHRAGLALGCEGSTVAQALQFVEWGVDMVEQNDLASLVRGLS